MLAVAVQVPACVVAAPRSELEPAANAGAASVSTAHVADARDLRFIRSFLLASTNEARVDG
jgi:hypothetical protein